MSAVECWAPIPGYEGLYLVSNMGRVKSVTRRCVLRGKRDGRLVPERMLALDEHISGYLMVSLNKEGIRKTLRVASLVAEAFIGPRPAGHQVCHNDGSRTNNRPENLRYDTCKGNAHDRTLHGTQQRGERASKAKLTSEAVHAIRQDDRPIRQIAHAYGVAHSTVSVAKRGITWSHL